MIQEKEQASTSFTAESTVVGETARRLAAIGEGFHRRGWVLGTSGNFSAVLTEQPLTLLITASGHDKGELTPDRFVRLDERGEVIGGGGKPSDETRLHLALVRRRGARAVLHTHSVWGTILSDAFAERGGIELTGWEMLKGLAGVRTHEHREWLPVLDNSQDMAALAAKLEELLDAQPGMHGFLLRGHGLYTWGKSLDEARRHIEILEFLLEVTGRIRPAGGDARKQ
ncbi:MAG: methylthioribulose 1-phosphate dehydratase [Blastocatellia bacterium]